MTVSRSGAGAPLDYAKNAFSDIRNQGDYTIKIRPAFRYMRGVGESPESWTDLITRYAVATIAYFPSGPMQFGWGFYNPKWQPSYRTHPLAWV